MTTPETIKIDSVEYVRKDSVKTPVEIGEKRIVVADRGWVFVGNCTDEEDGTITIRNAKNIRRWGTTKGLGELVNGPTEKTVYDEYETVKITPIFTMAVIKGW